MAQRPDEAEHMFTDVCETRLVVVLAHVFHHVSR
jgi:hypothetical protein